MIQAFVIFTNICFQEQSELETVKDTNEDSNENKEQDKQVPVPVNENPKSSDQSKVSTLDSWVKKSENVGKGRNKRSNKNENDKESVPKKSKTQTPVEESLANLDFNVCEKKTHDGKLWNFKISSWNVAGIRAWAKVRNSIESYSYNLSKTLLSIISDSFMYYYYVKELPVPFSFNIFFMILKQHNLSLDNLHLF